MTTTQATEAQSAEESDTAESASGDTRLAAAVTGIGQLAPTAPEGLLAPRLRTPLFSAFVLLAISMHAGGLAAYLLLGRPDGEGGRNARALGGNVIEVEIIEGSDTADKGARVQEASAGDPAPLALTSIDQAAAEAQMPDEPSPLPVAVSTQQPPQQVKEPPPAEQTALATEGPADTQVAALPPPPVEEIPQVRAVERPPEPQPERPDKPAEAQPEQSASQASLGGDAASAQADKEKEGASGRAGATPGEIRAYHTRLGSRLRAYKPSGLGRKGYVVVAFAVDADGSLLFAQVKQSTGNTYLEERALGAVRKAAPFPKPPARMSGKQLEFSVPFTFE